MNRKYLSFVLLALVVSTALSDAQSLPALQTQRVELSRSVRPWEFLPLVGEKAGVFGWENGRFEAWVYPLKILRDLHYTFHMEGRAVPADQLARTITVRPESATIVYADDTFSVRQTIFVPIHDEGAVILFDVETEQPLEIEASFVGDFQLEWPAGLGGTFVEWDPKQRAVVFGEEQHKFAALVGSPTATLAALTYQTNYSSSDQNSLRLGVTQKGRERKILVIAGSSSGLPAATETYKRLTASYQALLDESARYYSDYLARTVSLELPDKQLQDAFDWSRVSTVQGLVTNPALGTGLVAGYRTSGTGQRPGFAWYFGRDSLWTSFALNSIGDFATTKTALEFISKYQREDGKMPHEIAQGANFVPWFDAYPYGYASADSTPLYIIAVNDYVVRSGDSEYLKTKWDSLWRAYQFLRSTYDAQGFPRNMGIGHGWVEGGPLLPVKSEFYQSGLAVEALRALSNLARLAGKDAESETLSRDFVTRKEALNQTFWSDTSKMFAFALDNQDKRVDEASVLATVPMWFGVTDDTKAQSMITQLSSIDHQTDWGMRIISSKSKNYGAGGYHFGSVWPLFTGWASVGEYRYHRPIQAYANLRANAMLALDGSLGHVTEVLSGDYYQGLSTSSPHQIWSAAMVVSPILRGMLGLESDALSCRLTFAPHVPADWSSFAVINIQVGNARFDLRYQRSLDTIKLDIKKSGGSNCTLDFSPAISSRAQIESAELNGRKLKSKLVPSTTDQHVSMQLSVPDGASSVVVRVRNDFGLAINSQLPPLGDSTQGLRLLSEEWNRPHTELALDIEGASGKSYEIEVRNPRQIASVDGGKLSVRTQELGTLRVEVPQGQEPYSRGRVVLHFKSQ